MDDAFKPRGPAHRGVYIAQRASALSGVPLSTVYEWARGDEPLLRPSISSTKIKLWSWADLVALRAIRWLRRPELEGRRPTSMGRVRELITYIEHEAGKFGEALAGSSLLLRVDAGGQVYVERNQEVRQLTAWPQRVGRDLVVDLLSTFSLDATINGPNLLVPRERLRIIPGKLAGEPHVADTRIESRVIAALHRRGLTPAAIGGLYPSLTRDAIHDSVDLERQLERNIRAAA